jgi:flagellar basal-body rod protein FlgF
MDIATQVATSRLMAQQRAMEVTATNIANMNTPGYRALRTQFADWLSRQSNVDAAPGARVIAYTQDRATWRDNKPGTLRQTGNSFDLALTGDGYFAVDTANGTRLSRNGRFAPLADGTLADSAGNALLDTGGQPLRIGPTDTRITISGDGTISSENGQLGRVGVVRPEDPSRLLAQGDTLLDPRGPTEPVAAPSIVQGAVEDSNVHPVLELTRMINDHRQFEFVAQFVRAAEERQRDTIERLLPPGRGL